MLRRLLRNADIAVGILLAAVLAVLSALNVANQSIISAVVLAMLALVVSLFFPLRSTLSTISAEAEEQARILERLSGELSGEFHTSKVFQSDYPDLAHDIEICIEIFVVAGGTLSTSVGRWQYQFRSAAMRGARIRFLCPDPSNEDLMTRLAISRRSNAIATTNDVQAHLELALQIQQEDAKSRVEVRTVQHLPTFGAIQIKSLGKDAYPEEVILVKLLPFAHYQGATPVFKLEGVRDRQLQLIIKESMEELWSHGIPYTKL